MEVFGDVKLSVDLLLCLLFDCVEVIYTDFLSCFVLSNFIDCRLGHLASLVIILECEGCIDLLRVWCRRDIISRNNCALNIRAVNLSFAKTNFTFIKL